MSHSPRLPNSPDAGPDAGPGVEPPELGAWVKVYRFRRWRPAKVLQLGPRRALVQYLIPRGVKRVREAWVAFADMKGIDE